MKLHSMLAGAATLALGATLFTATSAFADTSGDYTYSVSGCSATITGYSGAGGAISIPSSFPSNEECDYTVTAIADGAFNGKGLTSVTVPFGVTSIGDTAFYQNHLTSSSLPAGLLTIGQYAFAYNDLLAITIPNNVITIGEAAFSYNSLDAVVIPDSVITIGERAFDSNDIGSVSIGSAVTTIGGQAFDGNNLTSVIIPASVISIGFRAFNGISSLQAVVFLGDAPLLVDNESSPVFDTTNPALTLYYSFGQTGFGSGPTWEGYNILEQGTVVTPSDVTAGVTAGVRSATLDPAIFGLVPFSHGEQLIDTTATLAVDDLTGAGVGWNVTLSASALTWTAANGGPTTGTDLPASALAVTTVGRVTTVAGDTWNGETALGSLGSSVKVLSTPGGNGSYTAPLTLTLTVPGQASVGTYAGTLTTTISAAP